MAKTTSLSSKLAASVLYIVNLIIMVCISLRFKYKYTSYGDTVAIESSHKRAFLSVKAQVKMDIHAYYTVMCYVCERVCACVCVPVCVHVCVCACACVRVCSECFVLIFKR